MNTFEKIIYALSARMEKPPLFGTWHIVSLVLTLALAAFMVWKFKNCSEGVTSPNYFVVTTFS